MRAYMRLESCSATFFLLSMIESRASKDRPCAPEDENRGRRKDAHARPLTDDLCALRRNVICACTNSLTPTHDLRKLRIFNDELEILAQGHQGTLSFCLRCSHLRQQVAHPGQSRCLGLCDVGQPLGLRTQVSGFFPHFSGLQRRRNELILQCPKKFRSACVVASTRGMWGGPNGCVHRRHQMLPHPPHFFVGPTAGRTAPWHACTTRRPAPSTAGRIARHVAALLAWIMAALAGGVDAVCEPSEPTAAAAYTCGAT